MECQLLERPALRHFAFGRADHRSITGPQSSYIPDRLRHSLWQQYTKLPGILPTSNQRIVQNPIFSALGRNSEKDTKKQRKGRRGLVSARAPFSDGDREVSRRARRTKPGRTLLLQSVLCAKQVITRTSGRRLGVVSQLWVDAVKWEVVALSVKPSLLFGEEDTILLSSLRQVGDVLLVHDESAVEENVSLVQLGYYNIVGSEVVTENGVYLGKIRDFKFDPEDGALASLVFDGLGISIVPSTVVSTYAMGIGEVLSAGSDRIIVRDGAASRVKRLSMGILEKLSLAEPPWKQDDILYSTYGSALERRQSRYESRPESRREFPEERSSRAPPNVSSRAPAYDGSRTASRASTPAYEPRRSGAYEDPRPAYEDARPAYEGDPRTPAYERAESPAYGTIGSVESGGRGSRSSVGKALREGESRYGEANRKSARRSDFSSRSSDPPASNMANPDLERADPVSERGNPVAGRRSPLIERRSTGLNQDPPLSRRARASPADETPGQRKAESEASPGRFRGAALGPGNTTGGSKRAADWDTALERYPARRSEFAEAREPVYLERGSFRDGDRGLSTPGPVERSPVRTEPSPRLRVGKTDREDLWRLEDPGNSTGVLETTGYDARPFDTGRGVRKAAVGPPRVVSNSDLDSERGALLTYSERNQGIDLQNGIFGRGAVLQSGEGGEREERRPVGQASADGNEVETSRNVVGRTEGVSSAQEYGQQRFGQAGVGRNRPGTSYEPVPLKRSLESERRSDADRLGGESYPQTSRDQSKYDGQALGRTANGNGRTADRGSLTARDSGEKEPISQIGEPPLPRGREQSPGSPYRVRNLGRSRVGQRSPGEKSDLLAKSYVATGAREGGKME